MKEVIYVLYLFCVFVLKNLRVGPLSIRVYATMLMIIYLISRNQLSNIEGKSYLKLYCTFILLYGVSLFLSGDPGISHYLHDVLAYYLVAIVIFISIPVFVPNELEYYRLIKCFSVFLLFDAIVTILQYRGLNIGWIISRAINNYESFIDDRVTGAYDSLLGQSLSIGLFPYAFENAPFLACGVCLMFSSLANNVSKVEELYYMLVIAVSSYACFATQQRSAFFAMAIFICLYLWMFSKKTVFYASILSLIGITILGWTINIDALGRIGEFSNASDESRRIIWQNSIRYILDHFMFGGLDNCVSEYGYPHNFFLGAFIYSGLLGAWAVIVLFFKALFFSIRQLFDSVVHKSSIMCLSSALATSLFQGMTHNNSMLNGDALLFFLLALLIQLSAIKNVNSTQNTATYPKVA